MKNMFILAGAPGCGKSTLVSTIGDLVSTDGAATVNDMVVSFDKFRDMFYPYRSTLDDGGFSRTTNGRVEKHVVDAARRAAEAKMLAGETVIVDNTNTRVKTVNYWVTAARTLGYTPYVVNCQDGLTVDDVMVRNRGRVYNRVSDHVVNKMFVACENTLRQVKDVQVITPLDMMDLFDTSHVEVDATKFDTVVVVGDVHGHGHALQEILAGHGGIDNTKTLYVFVGDYFDRAPSAEELMMVWNLVSVPRDNVILLEGNHEHNITTIFGGYAGESQFRQTRDTLAVLERHGITRRDVRRFVSMMRPAVVLHTADGDVFVSHAGSVRATARDIVAMPGAEYIYGTSARDMVYGGRSTYEYGVDDYLALHSPEGTVQVHGHRNKRRPDGDFTMVTRDRSTVINVEAGVSDAQGYVGYTVLDDGAWVTHRIPVTNNL